MTDYLDIHPKDGRPMSDMSLAEPVDSINTFNSIEHLIQGYKDKLHSELREKSIKEKSQ